MSDFVVKNGLQLGGSVKGSVGTVTGNATLDLSTGSAFEVTPTADVTFAFSNPPAAGNAQSFTVLLAPSATVTFTYPASVKWPSGTTPTAPADGETDLLTFYTDDGGTTYYGIQRGDNMS